METAQRTADELSARGPIPPLTAAYSLADTTRPLPQYFSIKYVLTGSPRIAIRVHNVNFEVTPLGK